MYLRDSIERMGTGTEDMANLCIEKGLQKPLFQQRLDFRVILYRDLQLNKDTNKDTNTLTVIQKKIIDLLEKNEYISISEISKAIEINIRNTKNNIAKLKEKGFIAREGNPKGGFWKVIEK